MAKTAKTAATSDHAATEPPARAAEAREREEPAAPDTSAMREPPEGFMDDAGDGWKTLITGRWRLEPGTEGYYCARFSMPETITVNQFRAIAPRGTHHTLLTIAEDEEMEPDGVGRCEANSNGPRNVLGTGAGPSDLALPDGVGMKLEQGEQLLLNLHLFNVSDQPLEGLSGTQVRLIAASEIEHMAEETLAGPIMLDIPVGGPHVQSGECTISHDVTLFAVGPHMHQIGIHLKAVAHSSLVGDVLLHDAPYDFENQAVHYLDKQLPLKKGDTVQVECTYDNTTGKPVQFGNSSLAEMCFAGLYRYPAGQQSYICAR